MVVCASSFPTLTLRVHAPLTALAHYLLTTAPAPCPSPAQTSTRTIAPASTAQSLFYSAPELLEALNYSGPPGIAGAPSAKRTMDGDVFSYAMLLYELFTG